MASEEWSCIDEIPGQCGLASLMHLNNDRVRRVMLTNGMLARRKRKNSVSPDKASEVVANLLRELTEERTTFRSCFTLWKRTRQILGLEFESHLRAELVAQAKHAASFEVSDIIVPRDQGEPLEARRFRALLLNKGFPLSINRAGTPTDHGYAQRLVGAFLHATQDWTELFNRVRPHECLEYLSPGHCAQEHGLPPVPAPALLSCLGFPGLDRRALPGQAHKQALTDAVEGWNRQPTPSQVDGVPCSSRPDLCSAAPFGRVRSHDDLCPSSMYSCCSLLAQSGVMP